MVKELEFRDIAAAARAAGEGALRVRDRDGSWRESRFGDVAVLLKSRTGVELLEETLTTAGVPFVFEGQSPLFTSQDVRDLHNCLTAIDDPADLVAVLGALRTPAFSCSDVDLWRWKEAGRSFSYLDGLPAGASDPVAQAFITLRSYHTLSRAVPVPRLIEQFVREMRMREKAALSRKGPERLRRINMIVELASVMSADQPVTLRDFADWLQRQADENARMPESVSEAPSTNAVRVMTIHGAKGLEFPVVIVASATDGQPNADTAQAQQWRDGAGRARLDVQLGRHELNMRTAGFDTGRQQDKTQSGLENVRLMYVAATRARDHLLVSLWRSTKSKGSLAERIEELMDGSDHLWEKWKPVPERQARQQQDGARESTERRRQRWIEDRESLVTRSSTRGYVTATGLRPPLLLSAALLKDESDAADSEPGRFGRGSAERGRAVHAVLQHADLAAGRGQDLAGLARRMADEHGIPGEAAQVEALAQRVLATQVVQRAGEAARKGRAWREVPVAAALPEGAGALEGQIDLIFEEPDGSGLTIVDYKTDRVEGRTVAEAAEPYLPQMGAYAWAVERVTGRPVTSAVLIFASLTPSAAAEGRPEYPVPDLQRWKDEAARLAAEILRSAT
jgi:ATP-dependent exoDNAse (exonuclease V) beta subunit